MFFLYILPQNVNQVLAITHSSCEYSLLNKAADWLVCERVNLVKKTVAWLFNLYCHLGLAEYTADINSTHQCWK